MAKSLRWHFREIRPGDTSREATGGEFFSNDSLAHGFPQALVREGIQNSLDAHSGAKPTRIRIFLSEAAGAADPASVAPFCESLFAHLAAEPNDRMEPPVAEEKCPFLVFEDFETKGLEGEIKQWSAREGKNPFFAFLRAEGVSGKSEKDRGRWGIGKFVFPRSSRARTFFALTVRESDQTRSPLLMGRAILHGHMLDDAERVPDGYFGKPELVKGCEFILPVDDTDVTARFETVFGIERKREPGLSVVVPWYLESEITLPEVVKAAIREYFLPISAGRLIVDVATPTASYKLDKESLDAVISSLGEAFDSEVRPLLDLARFATDDSTSGKRILLSPHSLVGGPRWGPELIPELINQTIRAELASGRPAAVRVPVTVKPKHRVAEQTHFDVYLVSDPQNEFAVTTFVRDDIAIPGQRPIRVTDYRALVHIEKGAMATLLGDAENPSHTQWNRDGDNFRTKYENGQSYLIFVQQSAKKILDFVNGSQTARDPDLLSDIFFRPGERSLQRPRAVQRRSKRGQKPPVPPPPLPPRLQRYVIRTTRSGFSIGPGKDPLPGPFALQVKAAYDIPSGDPFKKFHRADFSFSRSDIKFECGQASFDVTADNSLSLKIHQPGFAFHASGFDPNRDLVVRAHLMESPDDDTSA